jgi:tol-pal system protein YbgF
MLSFRKLLTHAFIGLSVVLTSFSSHAGLFDDEEARKAILDLRQKVDANKLASEAAALRMDGAIQKSDANTQRQTDEIKELKEGNATLRRSLLELQNQIEAQRAELANMRGQGEQLARDVADMQRRQKDLVQGVDERMRRFEPLKVSVDGREFTAEPAEKRDYEAAFAIFRKPDFMAAQAAFGEFLRRYPQSGYNPSALFWMGNAQYALRDYPSAVNNFRGMISTAPDHPKASEAALSIANCQIEMKDTIAARKTLTDLITVYPRSEAALAAQDRLARLR